MSKASALRTNQRTIDLCWTTTERFATSADESFVGADADLYFGLGISFLFSEVGVIRTNDPIRAIDADGKVVETGRASKLLSFRGLERVPVDEARAGDIIALAGMEKATVSNTIADPSVSEPIAAQPIDPPTLAMRFSVNDSPYAGREGDKVTSRMIRDRLAREYLEGQPMHRARPGDLDYFRRGARLLRQVHRAGVVHNDLAKEPNLLVRGDGSPAFLDFQLAMVTTRRGRLFRLLAWDDLRHLLKHKRTYCPQDLTRRERSILATPSLPSRIFRATVKPVYLFVTRRLLGWADREGAGDRGERR